MGAFEPDLSSTIVRGELDRVASELKEEQDLREKYPATWATRRESLLQLVWPLSPDEKRRRILQVLENHHRDDGWMFVIDIAGELNWGPRQLKVIYKILAKATGDHMTEVIMGSPARNRRPQYRLMNEEPDFYRADGNMICDICDKPYWKHPWEQSVIGFDGYPYLHRLCNGDLIKT